MINKIFERSRGGLSNAVNLASNNQNNSVTGGIRPANTIFGGVLSNAMNLAVNNLNQGVTGGIRPATFDPSIKTSGAPVNFAPKSISTMNSAFGMPMQNSFDRVMDTSVNGAMMQDVNSPDIQEDPNLY